MGVELTDKNMSGYYGGPEGGGRNDRSNHNENRGNTAPRGYNGPAPMHREAQQQQSLDKHYKENPRTNSWGNNRGNNRGNNSNWGMRGRGRGGGGGGPMFPISRGGLHRRKNRDDPTEEA